MGNRGCEPGNLLDLFWLVGQEAVYHWAVCLPVASFLVSATPLHGEEFLWLLVFQQMEIRVCAARVQFSNNTVKGAEGFDVKRLISVPT